MNFKEELKQKQQHIEQLLMKYLPKTNTQYNQLVIDAMQYSLMAGGKRIRPIFMYEAYRMCQGSKEAINAFMSAIEMIHTSSLIHDDLPAMDNDDLRRGMPTCHIKYREDIAILAGDALLNCAFEIMIEKAVSDPDINLIKAMRAVARASGTNGMIGGQVADVLNENKPIDLDCLNYIHLNKTSAMIEGSFMAGALLAGASDEIVEDFRRIGRDIGLAFQIQDDVLDVTSTQEILGKPINSDLKNQKTTYVTLKGIDESIRIVNELLEDAIDLLKKFKDIDSQFMVKFVEYLKTRES